MFRSEERGMFQLKSRSLTTRKQWRERIIDADLNGDAAALAEDLPNDRRRVRKRERGVAALPPLRGGAALQAPAATVWLRER